MAPTRKSRSVNKRFSNINEVSPNKDGGTASKSGQRKRKLSDMLGSPWSEDELERFYEAYRKYAKDWKKVAGVVRNRSIEMVEALYNMNRAYLSLPEGTASVAGLKALMTDHYNSVVQEGSDSEQESNDGSVISRKPPRRGRGKFRPSLSKGLDGHFPDLLHSPSVASNYGCLTLLKKKRSGGSRPRAVGKRTPRFPVSHLCEKDGREKYLPPNKHGPKLDVDAHDDEVAHILALALAEASQRGGSPQASHTPSKRTEHMGPSPVRNGEKMRADSEMTNAKFIGNAMEECLVEGSLGSREAENGDCARDKRYLNGTEGVSTSEVQKKGKKLHRKKSKIHDTGNVNFDDVREACSGTEEGHNVSAIRGKSEMEVSGEKNERFSPQSSRRRSKRLIFGADESLAFDALQTLANLSLMMPASTIESESSVQFKEERIDAVDKSNLPGAISASNQRDKQKASGAKDTVHRPDAGFKVTPVRNSKAGRDPSPNLSAISDVKQQLHQKKSRKFKFQSPKDEGYSDSHLSEPHKIEVSAEDGKKYTSKGKRTTQITTLPKQGKPVRPLERSSSTSDQRRAVNDMALSAVQVPTGNQVNLPTKLRSRRKMVLEKPLSCKDLRCTEKNINVERPSKPHPSLYDCAFNIKEKLFYCFSSPLVRRWCAFEWFYSAIDYPWFAKREFVEYLNHVGLGHVPRLTRVEWGVIRSSLGKPRRLSEQFLREEKEKLQQYRESVRTHYTELRAGIGEGLPTDLARPLSVGQRVIAIHPKTREIHDGSILTVDRSRCRVQFDRPDLGVEFVMDIDCMPLSPLENMPEALRRQHIVLDKAFENFNEPKMIGRSKDWKTGGYMKFAPNENVENAYPPSHVSSLAEPLSTLLKQATGDSINAISQAKVAASEILSAQQATCSQPCTLAQIQAREADVRALSELTRALNKKEALVLELRHMNDEVDDSLKYGDNSLKDSESFRKLYAAIFIQLKEVDDQVSSALTNLRQRNTYQVNSPPPWPKPVASSGGPGGLTSSFTHSSFDTQESGSNLTEIVESSREKAQPMVEAAIQAMLSSRDGEDALMKIRQALCMTNSRHIGADLGMAAIVSSAPSDRVHTTLVYHDQAVSCISEQLPNSHTLYSELNNDSDQTEACLVGELLSSCVATMLMIQTCTERQYPPAEVAQILDSAVTSLKPCCSQNSSIYKEMQMCMGMIKTQILALIPT